MITRRNQTAFDCLDSKLGKNAELMFVCKPKDVVVRCTLNGVCVCVYK